MSTALEKTPRTVKEPLDHTSLIITIDGSTTAGKRVIGEQLAKRYDLTLFNTGTTIRALALLAIENKLVKTDETNVTFVPVDFADRVIGMIDQLPSPIQITKPRKDERTARVMVGNRDMHGELLAFRKLKAIDNLSSMIAASPVIRERLYSMWRDAVKELGGVVVIGRRTGVDLFPEAPVKLYLFASPQASAAYRVTHDPTAMLHRGTEELYVRERDGTDRERGLLDRPVRSYVIDTSPYISRNGNGIAELEAHIAAYIDTRFDIR